MQTCRNNLTRWVTKHRKDYARILNLNTNQLKELQDREGPKEKFSLCKLNKEIAELLEIEEINWR